MDYVNNGHIALEGLNNTRDLGGLPLEQGGYVSPKLLLRSGALGTATQHDLDTLFDEYQLSCVIDLRTEIECHEQPDPQEVMERVHYVHLPVLSMKAFGLEEGDVSFKQKVFELLGDLDPSKVMEKLYPSLLLEKKSITGYRRFFAELLAQEGDGAFLWHCSQGKDRTGIAAVLLLHALGVPQNMILEDYLATNKFMVSQDDELELVLEKYHLPETLIDKIMLFNSANERFMQAAMDAVDAECGGMDAYLKEVLEISDREKAELRELYTSQ